MNRRTKNLIKEIVKKTISILLLAAGCVLMLLPFLWAISSSLAGRGQALTYPPQFFVAPYYWSNYATAMNELNFAVYIKNSFILTGISCLAQPLSSAFAAFGLSRYDNKMVRIVTGVVLALIVIPVAGSRVPMYVFWKELGFLDTYVPILAPYFFGTVFNVYLIRQNFKSLPGDFYDAALIDGCNPVYIFLRIYLPLGKAILAVVVLHAFSGEWNDMMQPLIYITSKSKYNLAVGLLYAKGNYLHRQEVLMASSVIMMAPSIVIYAFLQKYFVQGLASAGVKG